MLSGEDVHDMPSVIQLKSSLQCGHAEDRLECHGRHPLAAHRRVSDASTRGRGYPTRSVPAKICGKRNFIYTLLRY